ncbi:MAG TPA: hypothetical protein DEO70_02000 [Bacteroidales bacterium]|nr:hypothetical protein [Bacteroidales bacterium]
MHPTNHPANRKLLRYLCLLLLLFQVTEGNAQGEWNNWYFGAKAGIRFQDEPPPVALLDGECGVGWTVTSVISDSSGQFLFATNGGEVYNRLQQIMQNGNMLHGYNNYEAVITVPFPSNPGKYYIFTDGLTGLPPAPPGFPMEYNIVDMALDNGLGGIMPGFKNVPVPGAENSSGTVTAVPHQNNRDFWIIVQTWNLPKKFLVFLLTNKGLQPPVISPCTLQPTLTSPTRMRFSGDGQKFVCLYSSNPVASFYSFDPSNGIIVPKFTFSCMGQFGIASVEFSVDGKYLYIITTNNPFNCKIAQFNADLTDSISFVASETKVANTNYQGKMQLGPDWKIYISKSGANLFIDSLSVIHHPELPALLCGYQNNYVPLLGRSGMNSIPTFVQRYFAYINHTGYCQGMPVTFEPNTWPPPDSLWWNFGDPASGTANFSNDSTPEHTFSSAGTFTVQMIVRHIDMRYDTATVNITIEPQPSPNLGPDRTVCENQTVVLDAGFNPQWTYLWSTGATTSSIAVSNSGTYGVTVTSPNSCIGSDSVVLSILPGSTPLPKQIRHN